MKIYEIQNKGKGIITTLTPSNLLLLNPPLYFGDTSDITISGVGSEFFPILASLVPKESNPQKEILTNYTLADADKGYTIFINNGATPITINVDSTITTPNFGVGFIQQGLGDVTFVGTGITLSNPIGLKSKGQGYATYIERKLITSTFYLLGDTKN